MKRFYYPKLFALVSAGLVLATLAVPQRAGSQADLARMSFGEPIPFLMQDFSILDPPRFPWAFGAPLSPWEYPTHVRPGRFLLLWAAAFGFLQAAARLASFFQTSEQTISRSQHESRSPAE